MYLLKHHTTHDIRAIDPQLPPCCMRQLWAMLTEQLGYVPWCPQARAYAQRLQLAVVPTTTTN